MICRPSPPEEPRLAGCRGENAFSLVEVAIAIGILSIAVLAILSLLSVGLQASRESNEETALAMATQQVDAWSRSEPFSALAASAELDEVYQRLTFDESGMFIRDTTGANITTPTGGAGGAAYQCSITARKSGISDRLLHLHCKFESLLAPSAAPHPPHWIVLISRLHEE